MPIPTHWLLWINICIYIQQLSFSFQQQITLFPSNIYLEQEKNNRLNFTQVRAGNRAELYIFESSLVILYKIKILILLLLRSFLWCLWDRSEQHRYNSPDDLRKQFVQSIEKFAMSKRNLRCCYIHFQHTKTRKLLNLLYKILHSKHERGIFIRIHCVGLI